MYDCPLNYWAEAHSLYNPALISLPPAFDASSSFSEPYLQESSRLTMESSQYDISPVKGFHLEYSFNSSMDNTLIVDVVNYDNDDVFL